MPDTLGKRVAKRRQELGLTQAQLAASAKLTQGSISNLENDVQQPSVETLKRLCAALKIESNHLLIGS